MGGDIVMWNYKNLKNHENQFLKKVESGEVKQDVTPEEDGQEFSKEFVKSLETSAQKGYNKHRNFFEKIK